MITGNHRPNGFPAPCCECETRTPATCCVDQSARDKYGTLTTKPECFCRAHCPVCGGHE